MSIFGTSPTSRNIFGIPASVSKDTNEIDVTNILLEAFDTIEAIEEMMLSLIDMYPSKFNINPEMGFKDVTVNVNFVSMFARRLYYKNGFSNLPDGSCDCDILRRLYQEHPILRQYSFELNEPKCCQ